MSFGHRTPTQNRTAGEQADESELDRLRRENEEQKKQLAKLRSKLKNEPEKDDREPSKNALARSNRRVAQRAEALGLDINELKRETGQGGGIASLPREVLVKAGIIGSQNRAVVHKDGGLYLNVVSTAEAVKRRDAMRLEREELEESVR